MQSMKLSHLILAISAALILLAVINSVEAKHKHHHKSNHNDYDDDNDNDKKTVSSKHREVFESFCPVFETACDNQEVAKRMPFFKGDFFKKILECLTGAFQRILAGRFSVPKECCELGIPLPFKACKKNKDDDDEDY